MMLWSSVHLQHDRMHPPNVLDSKALFGQSKEFPRMDMVGNPKFCMVIGDLEPCWIAVMFPEVVRASSVSGNCQR